MASIRKTKKEVTFLINEVISNGYMALYFQGAERQDDIIAIISKAVELHNDTISKLNHPIEKHNPSLVRKHYRAVRENVFTSVDDLFMEISKVCQA